MEDVNQSKPALAQHGLWSGQTLASYQEEIALRIRALIIRFQLLMARLEPQEGDSLAIVMQAFYQISRMSLNSIAILTAINEFRENIERNLAFINCPDALYNLFKFYQRDDGFLISRSTSQMGFQILLKAVDLGSKKAKKELIFYIINGEYFKVDRAWIAWMLEEIRLEKNHLFSQEKPSFEDFEASITLLHLIEAIDYMLVTDINIDELPMPDTAAYQRMIEEILGHLNDMQSGRVYADARPSFLSLEYRLDGVLTKHESYLGDSLKFVVDDYFSSDMFNRAEGLSSFEAIILSHLSSIEDFDGLFWFYQGLKQKSLCQNEALSILRYLDELGIEEASLELATYSEEKLQGALRV
jgi:hypothetical protein